ncbi:MAG: hypothetical protein ACLPKB_31915 [Xanthobacteraceae bacterium]
MLTLVLIWVGVCAVMMLLGNQGRPHSAGLPLAYLLGLSIIHVPGAMVYIDSENWETKADWTRVGFEQTVIGMVAFLVGVLIARFTSFASRQGGSVTPARDLAALDRLGVLYFSAGLVCFMSMQFLGSVASLSAIISSLGALMIVGACLRLWVARQGGDRGKQWQTIAVLPLLPLLTLVKDGFLGFGTYWVLAIGAFVLNQSKRSRAVYFVLAPIVAFVGLSTFVNYMASRDEYRKLVWYQQIGIGDRIQRIADIFQNFEWVDFANSKHRFAIDGRLNQNLLIGLAAQRLESGSVDYASGATIGEMIVALIPRALWPDKPQVGGGGNVVQHFTGFKFAEGTSVGAGQVLEFYVNFGVWGVIGGFLVLGWLIGFMDLRIIDSLERGEQSGFVLWFLIGAALLNPGGNLLEVVTTSASAAIAGKGIGYLLNRRFAWLTAGRGAEPGPTATTIPGGTR